MRHFIDTQNFTKTELVWLMDLIGLLKTADRERALPPLLAGASLGMIFEEPSTRTRISFEVAMTKLGGHALYLKPGEIHLGVRESIKDSARVISRMVDAIEARTLKHATVTELARINGLTDYNHPTQVLCDVFTMREHRPVGKPLEALTVAFIGDATNVCSSLMMICTQMGMTFVHCAPPRYQAPEAWQSIARDNCAQSGGRLWVTDDPALAVAEADFVYTDLWWWVGQEAEIPERQAAFMPRYQINDALLAKAPPHAKFMHCLPASRGVEVTDAVMDGPRAIIYDQAENRLHAEKAILVAFVRPHLKLPSARRSAQHAHVIDAFLNDHQLTGAATPVAPPEA